MPPAKHAVLSASASHRWLHCNPSARLELEFKDRETAAAAEGTAAHALCEHKLKRKLKLRSERPISNFDNDEMEQYTDDYTDFVMERRFSLSSGWTFPVMCRMASEPETA